MSRSDVLVVSATKAEVVHVPSEFEVLITGIGKVSAAVRARCPLMKHGSDHADDSAIDGPVFGTIIGGTTDAKSPLRQELPRPFKSTRCAQCGR